ncbi:AAA family ATPase [Kitasatospora sp. NPDC059646]|uniref:AAA family ATPase n=1 Tax=Kitasatospora sp. NPDC059646 TaxID=3346893 RepID=UPI0036D03012
MLNTLGLPPNSLIALIGCAGSGKSSLSAMFPRSWVLSSDRHREDVADDAGDQSANSDAWNLLYARLDARLGRGLPAVVDATSADASDRAQLLTRARRHGAPAVALVLDVDVSEALRRNALRPPSRRVPPAVVVQQHSRIAAADLAAEGFARVVRSGELPVLSTVLHRLAAEHGTRTDLIEATFGTEAARLITWDVPSRAPEHRTATLAAGGEELLLRYQDGGDPYDHRFEVEVGGCPNDADCPGPAWSPVHHLGDLLAAQAGNPANESRCDACEGDEYGI